MTSITCDSQLDSHFFRLPLELRNQIYSYLLVSYQTPRLSRDITDLSPSILQTCHRIHNEALPLLYSTTFTAHPTLLTHLPYFGVRTRPVPPSHTHLINRWTVMVRLDVDSRFTGESVRAAFNGCRELTVEVMQAMYGSCDFGRLKEFEGVRGVGQAKVVGSLGDGRYGRWLQEVMMLPAGEKVGDFGGLEEDEGIEDEVKRRTKEFGRSWRLGDACRREGVEWDGNR